VIVMKFGGTSLADADRIRAAAEIVRGRLPRGPIVVVSALAGVTDLLVRAVAHARQAERDALEPILSDLVRRHRWAVSGVDDPRRRHDLGLAVDALFEELRQLLRSMRILGEGTPRSSDALLAYGELLASRIATAIFADRGIPARLVDAREVVLTDERHGAAEPSIDEVAARGARLLVPVVAGGSVPVLAGFVGATRDGRATTLGRGGSDASAAILGSALAAEEIEIWTDVDGVMSADPRRVPAATTRASVSFAEAAELAFYGAKVLHPASIAPAVRRNIPVRVLNSMRPEGSGTVIVAEVAPGSAPIASVASRAGVSAVRVASRTLRIDPGFLPRVLATLEEERLAPDLVVSSEVAVTLVLPGRPEADGLARKLADVAEVEVRGALGVVCVVGAGLAADGGTRARALAAIARLRPELVAMGGSASSVAAVVPEDRLDDCVRALHAEFFEGAAA